MNGPAGIPLASSGQTLARGGAAICGAAGTLAYGPEDGRQTFCYARDSSFFSGKKYASGIAT